MNSALKYNPMANPQENHSNTRLTLARKAIERMIETKTEVIIFSLTEEQSMIILSMAQNYLLEKAPSLMSKKKIDTNKKTLTLKNGSKMKCRPAGDTGDSGRGFEGGIVGAVDLD
jgi:hypothetical protein